MLPRKVAPQPPNMRNSTMPSVRCSRARTRSTSCSSYATASAAPRRRDSFVRETVRARVAVLRHRGEPTEIVVPTAAVRVGQRGGEPSVHEPQLGAAVAWEQVDLDRRGTGRDLD